MIFGKSNKIFCVGFNKTGTTSLTEAMKTLGYTAGKQSTAERFLEDWSKRDFSRIIKYCKSADFFQDVPFSLPYTYQALDQALPGSRFILTVRDSPEQWYHSLLAFHTKIIGKDRVPTADDLKAFSYRYPGYIWQFHQMVFGANTDNLYDKAHYMACYETHREQVINYFKYRADDLLVLNLGIPGASEALSGFLRTDKVVAMPHLNRTS